MSLKSTTDIKRNKMPKQLNNSIERDDIRSKGSRNTSINNASPKDVIAPLPRLRETLTSELSNEKAIAAWSPHFDQVLGQDPQWLELKNLATRLREHALAIPLSQAPPVHDAVIAALFNLDKE